MPIDSLKPLKQVAALPLMMDAAGSPLVLIITSRETKRLVIPKGWPMKGRADHEAAAFEAKQEAGLIGRVHHKPVGTYSYWKRRTSGVDLVDVRVYLMEVTRRLEDWREKAQRESFWLSPSAAAELIAEPALADLVRALMPQARSA